MRAPGARCLLCRRVARYFEQLRYSFGPRERAGFYTFLEMARDVGELVQVPELRFLPIEPAPV